MSGSAQRERRLWPEDDVETAAADLKQMAAERLAAHRSRRSALESRQSHPEPAAPELAPAQPGPDRPALTPDASRVRDAVAAQYRQRQSYREYLASQAELAMEQARADVEVAERKARAVAEAQVQLLAEIELWEHESLLVQPELVPPPMLQPQPPAVAEARLAEAKQPVPADREQAQRTAAPAIVFSPTPPPPATSPAADEASYAEEQGELDREIAFRLAPQFDDHLLEALPIQANVLEFPRQLVAARRARPRLAEGPLLELAAAAEAEKAAPPQLRIFEVEPEQISPQPPSWQDQPAQAHSAEPAAPPEWQRMVLDAAVVFAEPAPERHRDSAAPVEPGLPLELSQQEPGLLAPIYPCGVDRRLMAGLVDASCIAAATIGFACVAVAVSGRTLSGISRGGLAAAAIGLLAVFFALYQFLFLSLGDQTPGMMYARIGLCTFSDENPTRRQRCRRAWATLLAALPLGLGLLRMAIDIDHLGWHDRRTRTYLREY